MFKWPRQHANYYSKYGVDGARALAQEYVRRSHYFFALWIQSDDDDFHFEKRHFDECPEDPVFLEWLCGQPIDSDAFARGSDLHALRPLNP